MVLELLLLLLPHVAAASVAAPAWQLTTPLRRHAPPQLALAPAEVRPRRRQQREDARVAVRFVPSFKAAQRARGVVHGSGDSSEYVVTPRASPAEIRAMLNGLCSTGQLEPAISLLAHRLATSARGSDAEGLSSIVLNACANAGRMDLTRGVLTAMREHHVPIGLLTFCILIKGYGRAGDVDRVTRTYTAMQQLRLAPDLATLNALLDAYARNGRLAEAEGVLVEMDKAAVEPSSRTYNTLIKGYSNAHRLQEAFGVVRRMRSALGPNGPNEVTYSTLIHACVRDGQLGRARTILSWLGDDANPLRPDVWAYTALLRGLLADSGGGARRVDEALALLDEMLKLGVSPNEATVSTLITGCFDRGNVSAAREAADTVRTHASQVGDARLALATDEAMIVGLCRPRQPTSAADDASHQVSLPLDTGRARDPQRLRDALRLFVSCQSSSVSRGNSASRSPNGGGASSGASSSSSSSSSSASSSATSNSSGQRSDAYAAANGSADGLRLGTRTCNALLAALVASGEVSSATHVLLSDVIASDDLE